MNYSVRGLNAMVSQADYSHECMMFEWRKEQKEVDQCKLAIKAVPSPMIVCDDELFNGCVTHFHPSMIDAELRMLEFIVLSYEDTLDF